MNCGMGTGLQRGVISSLGTKQDQLAIRDLLEREPELEHQAPGRDRGIGGSHGVAFGSRGSCTDLLLVPMRPEKLAGREKRGGRVRRGGSCHHEEVLLSWRVVVQLALATLFLIDFSVASQGVATLSPGRQWECTDLSRERKRPGNGDHHEKKQLHFGGQLEMIEKH